MVPLHAALSHTCGNLLSVSDASAPLMTADQLGGAGKERPAVVTQRGAAEDVPEAALAAGGSYVLAGTDVLHPIATFACISGLPSAVNSFGFAAHTEAP
jgi:hypothetical protein